MVGGKAAGLAAQRRERKASERFHWAGAAHMLLKAAECQGVPKDRVLHSAGMTGEELPAAPGRMPWPRLQVLTQAALELTGEPALGLLAGARVHVGNLGVAGTYFMHVSPVRRSQAMAYEEVWPRLTNLIRFWHEESGDLAFNCGEIVPPEEPWAEPHLHMRLAMHVTAFRALFGTETKIDHVALRSTAAGDAARLSALIGCPVVTGQPRDWVAVPRAMLDRPLPLANPWLCRQLRPQLDAYLQLLDGEMLTTMAVRTTLEGTVGSGAPVSMAAVAERMSMRSRTLRARLAAEGTTFSAVLDAIRKEFSLRQLSSPGVKLAAVAAQTGFSDPSAFNRAFRRWTGVAPQRWRDRQRASAEASET